MCPRRLRVLVGLLEVPEAGIRFKCGRLPPPSG